MGCCQSAKRQDAKPQRPLPAECSATAPGGDPADAQAPLDAAEQPVAPEANVVQVSEVDEAKVAAAVAAAELAAATAARQCSMHAKETVDSARAACHAKMERGDVFGAEVGLLEAVTVLGAEGAGSGYRQLALESLRASEEYRRALEQLERYEQAVKRVLGGWTTGGDGWTLGAEVPVCYKSLEVELSPEADVALPQESRVINVIWRIKDGKLEIRIAAVLPTMPANSSDSSLVGWLAMNAETELYHTWHPVVNGNGPKVLQQWNMHHNLYHMMLKILWVKLVQLQEQHVFNNFESGAHVLVVEDLPLESDLWRQYPAPDKFTPNPDPTTMSVVILPQDLTSFVGVHLVSEMHSPPPAMVLKLIVSWVFPEVVRRILRAGGRCLAGNGPHAPLIREDANGIYSEARRLVQQAQRIDRARVKPVSYTPKQPPDIGTIISRSRSLLEYEARAGPLMDHVTI